MSKYDYVTHEIAADVELAEDEAIAAIIMLGMQVSAGTEFSIKERLGSFTYFQDYTLKDFVELSEKVLSLIREFESGPLFGAAVSQVPKDIAELVFDMVVKITISDRQVTPEEISYMSAVGTALKIPVEVVKEIVEENLSEPSDEEDS